MVAVLMFTFRILSPNEIAKAFMNDTVFFILGILVVAVGVHKTGLDKRIGLLLLSQIKSAGSFALIFFPILAVTSGFLSAHALVAFLVPVMMGVYKATCSMYDVKHDRVLAIFLLLGVTFAANAGGPRPCRRCQKRYHDGVSLRWRIPYQLWRMDDVRSAPGSGVGHNGRGLYVHPL